MITTITHAAAFVLPAIAAGSAAAFVAFTMRPQAMRVAVAATRPGSPDLSVKRNVWAIDEAYGTTTGTTYDPQSRGRSG
jgi:hypothetical protein